MSDDVERLRAALADRYAVETELGRGGMATVYRAQDLKHERWVAIKVLRPDIAAALGAERFLREIKITAQLNHPHILMLLDSGEVEGFLYYVMPYVEGESLRDRLNREKQLPIDDALHVTREVADALSYAHSHGVIHRDIKPENILLESGHAVVADFGIARAIAAAGGEQLTETGVAIGTPAYMSPEQVAGGSDLDRRSDIYSLGCVLYEVLAGQPPFTGPTLESIVHQHLAAEPPLITNIRPAVPAELAETLARALAKTPADRFGSAAQFAEVLALPSGGATTMAVDEGAVLRRSHPARVAGLFGLASVALLAVVYFLMMALGLPDWVLPGALLLLAVGLPIMLVTAHIEKRRALAPEMARPGAEGALQRWLTWRNAVLGGVLAFAGLGITVTGYTAMRVLGIGPPATLMATGVLEERERLILAEFENRTPDSTLGTTVTQLFRVGLTQSLVVNVLEPTQVGRVLARMEREPDTPLDPTLAMEVAEREGIKAVITGDIISVGSGFALSAGLITPTGEILTGQQESADDANGIIAAVGRLSGKLRERIGESLRTIRGNEPLHQVTTGSLRALRLYSQALRAENAGDFVRATRLLEEAVAADTAFAMAYRKLGVILANTREQPARRVEAVTKAFEHRDRLTERERYRAIGMYNLSVMQEWEAAIDAYRTLLDIEPDDAYALVNLSVLYWLLRDHARGEEISHRVLALDSSHPTPFWNLAELQLLQGKFDEAEVTLERFAAWHPGNPSVTSFRANFEQIRGNYDAAETEFRRLREDQRGSLFWAAVANEALAQLAALRGKVAESERHWRDALAATEQRGLAGEYLKLAIDRALMDLFVRDRPAQAVTNMEAALEQHPLDSIDPLDRPYDDLILLYAFTDRLVQARALVAEYEATGTAQYNRTSAVGYRRTLGALALVEERAQEAVTEFRRSDDGPCVICALPGLARAYDLAGQSDSALAVYQRYITTPMLDRITLDYLNLPIAYRRLGELYEQRGAREQAIQYYNKFVELWQDADRELQPQVREVRDRLARLVAEPGSQ